MHWFTNGPVKLNTSKSTFTGRNILKTISIENSVCLQNEILNLYFQMSEVQLSWSPVDTMSLNVVADKCQSVRLKWLNGDKLG